MLRDALALPGLELGALTEVLLEAIRFAPFPDTVPALRDLRAAGLRLVAASNWDVSLHEQLERTGLRALLDGAVSSAEAGAAKPDPAILVRALAIAGAEPGHAWHVGDDLEADVGAARAAGVQPVLIDREGVAERAARRAADRLAGGAAGALCVEWTRSDDERSASFSALRIAAHAPRGARRGRPRAAPARRRRQRSGRRPGRRTRVGAARGDDLRPSSPRRWPIS